jgi:tetratricopeptide (TPR) repeat protein
MVTICVKASDFNEKSQNHFYVQIQMSYTCFTFQTISTHIDYVKIAARLLFVIPWYFCHLKFCVLERGVFLLCYLNSLNNCALSKQIGQEQIEALYQYAKFQFECGNYSGAADYLYQYRGLCNNSERSLSALWGKMAAEILMQNWDIALEELNRLKEIIDSKVVFHHSLLFCLSCMLSFSFYFSSNMCLLRMLVYCRASHRL